MFRAVGLAALALVITACQAGSATAPPSAPAAPASAAAAPAPAAVALKVSYSNVIADNLPEWMAYEAGIFKQNGLDVELTNIASSNGVAALLAGQIQMAH